MNRATIAGGALFAVIAVVLVVQAVSVAGNWSELRPRVSGDPAPEFSLPTVASTGELGAPLALSSMRGRVVILDFWATWCGPCRTTMPLLEDVANKYRSRGVELISINTEGRGKAQKARRMLDRLSPSALLVSDGGLVADAYGVTTIPHLALIDRDGTIRWVHRGGLRSSKTLASEIERLLD